MDGPSFFTFYFFAIVPLDNREPAIHLGAAPLTLVTPELQMLACVQILPFTIKICQILDICQITWMAAAYTGKMSLISKTHISKTYFPNCRGEMKRGSAHLFVIPFTVKLTSKALITWPNKV